MNGAQKTIKILAILLGVIIIINIFYFLFSFLSFFSGSDLNVGTISSEKTMDFNQTYQNIQNIEIDVGGSDITIISGDEFKIEASDVTDKFSVSQKNKTLKIKENNKVLHVNNYKGNVLITIPKGIRLEELDIDAGAGKFKIENIEVNKFEIDHGAGTLEISNSIFYKTDIDGGAGMINIDSSTLNNLDMDTGVGSVEIEASITGNSEIECGVGEINMTLLGNENEYSISTEKGIGSIKIKGESQNNNSTYGNGNNRIKVEGGVGNIAVNFKNLDNSSSY